MTVYIYAVVLIVGVIQSCVLFAGIAKKFPEGSVLSTVTQIAGFAIGLWLLLGFLPYMLWLEFGKTSGSADVVYRPNEMGDAFGMVTSIFTAFAMVGATLTVYLQRQEITRQDKAHSKEIDIAQKTARMQTMISLMDVELRLMNESLGGECTRHRRRATALYDEVAQLLAEMGQAVERGPSMFMSPVDLGISKINRLFDQMNIYATAQGYAHPLADKQKDECLALWDEISDIAHTDLEAHYHLIHGYQFVEFIVDLMKFREAVNEKAYVPKLWDNLRESLVKLHPPEPYNLPPR